MQSLLFSSESLFTETTNSEELKENHELQKSIIENLKKSSIWNVNIELMISYIQEFKIPFIFCLRNLIKKTKETRNRDIEDEQKLSKLQKCCLQQFLMVDSIKLKELPQFDFLDLRKTKLLQIKKNKGRRKTGKSFIFTHNGKFINTISEIDKFKQEIIKFSYSLSVGNNFNENKSLQKLNQYHEMFFERKSQSQICQNQFQAFYFSFKIIELDHLLVKGRAAFRKMAKHRSSEAQYQIKEQTKKLDNYSFQSKIFTNQSKKMKQSKNHNCPYAVETYFFESQQLYQAQTIKIEYKNYKFPFGKNSSDCLQKNLAAFLNTQGGIIYVGIQEQNHTRKKIVEGLILNEDQKELFHKKIRSICDTIYPQITGSRLVKVAFVPIKNSKREYIPGKCVAKIIVKQGKPGEVYATKINQYVVTFRTENEVLTKDPSQDFPFLINYIKGKMKEENHNVLQSSHCCPNPELGVPLYSQIQLKLVNVSQLKLSKNSHNYSVSKRY